MQEKGTAGPSLTQKALTESKPGEYTDDVIAFTATQVYTGMSTSVRWRPEAADHKLCATGGADTVGSVPRTQKGVDAGMTNCEPRVSPLSPLSSS